MKKFLSLVLALVMTMSLVTISAGATEYKDLTDKDEIQYEEAVAVLNRIGVITGYDDGSFQPAKELTRGAAAKIIVSLLIGPEAASNLPNNYAPYPDVPAGHTFAGVISYCKTANIISGYGDGTFKPGNTLTGYAFAKMLLGAVGYNSDYEKFTDTGWTMNVASVGQSAGLFDRLKFDGSKAVTREEACQLALNALKATVVTYDEGINVSVTGDNTNVVVSGGHTRNYKTSNQEFARNIRVRQGNSLSNGSLVNQIATDYYTVEFAEEHFVDLRLEHDKYNPTHDQYGRPSAEWSYKKVTIGTYPLEADFEFTTQVAHLEATDAAKERALGLRNYDLDGKNYNNSDDTTRLWWNGVLDDATLDPGADGKSAKIADIADLTDNGTLVQVYVSNYDADFITDVVVIQTQLMEIDQVKSDYVSLKRVESDNAAPAYGYNQPAIHVEVENVRSDDAAFAVLKELKSGDKVAVIPVAQNEADNDDFEVGKVYVPETVSGKLTKVSTYGSVGTDRNAIDITVGDTTYKIADWNDKMIDLDANKIKITKKDVTLLLDEYGNALLAKDVGETSEYMIVGSFGLATQGNKLVNVVNGWTVGGEAVSLNVGNVDYTSGNHNVAPGDLVKYTSASNSNTAEWKLLEGYGTKNNLTETPANTAEGGAFIYDVSNNDKIQTRNVGVDLVTDIGGSPDYSNFYFADDVKFIYVSFDEDGDVESIEIFSDIQDVETTEIDAINTEYASDSNPAQAYTTDKGFVKAVVIKQESNNAKLSNSGYIVDYDGEAGIHTENGKYQGYRVAWYGPDGKWDDSTVIYSDKVNLPIGSFFTYTKKEAPVDAEKFNDNFYDMKVYNRTTRNTSSAIVNGMSVQTSSTSSKLSKDLFNIGSSINPAFSVTRMDGVTELNYSASFPGTPNPNQCNVLGGADGYGPTDFKVGSMRLAKNVKWLDMRDVVRNNKGEEHVDSLEDLDEFVDESIKLAILFNDNPDSGEFRSVYIIVVLDGYKRDQQTQANFTAETTRETNTAGLGVGDTVTFKTTVTPVSRATVTTSYNYTWYVQRGDAAATKTVHDKKGLSDTFTLTLTAEDIADPSATKVWCVVTAKDSDKVGVSEAQTTVKVNLGASEAPFTVTVAASTDLAALKQGDAVTFTATVSSEEVAATATYAWGYINAENEFVAFTEAELTTLGVSAPQNSTLEIANVTSEIATLLAGKKISCQVTSAAGGTGITTPPATSEGAELPSVIPDPNAPAEGEAAVTFTVTDESEAIQRIVIDGKTSVPVAGGSVNLSEGAHTMRVTLKSTADVDLTISGSSVDDAADPTAVQLFVAEGGEVVISAVAKEYDVSVTFDGAWELADGEEIPEKLTKGSYEYDVVAATTGEKGFTNPAVAGTDATAISLKAGSFVDGADAVVFALGDAWDVPTDDDGWAALDLTTLKLYKGTGADATSPTSMDDLEEIVFEDLDALKALFDQTSGELKDATVYGAVTEPAAATAATATIVITVSGAVEATGVKIQEGT